MRDFQRLFVCFSDTPAVTCRGIVQWRNFSSSQGIDVSYEQLKQLLAAGTTSVIDVREPWELREYGNIPGSINVPCKSPYGVLSISVELTLPITYCVEITFWLWCHLYYSGAGEQCSPAQSGGFQGEVRRDHAASDWEHRIHLFGWS